MAESAMQRQDQSKFFCHECSQEINPKMPDLTCPRCQSGFIEEMTSERMDQETANNIPHDATSQFAELWGRSLMESMRQHTGQDNPDNNEMSDDDNDAEYDGPPSSRTRSRNPHNPFSVFHQLSRPHIQFTRGGGSRNELHRISPIDAIVQQLLGGLTGGSIFAQGGGIPITLNLGGAIHGNPGDYAWGAGGLDAIITQFLNQLDGTGPPPAAKDKIDELPTVNISAQQVELNLQCSVCMEDFALDESVRKLPCNHHYHNDCIIPWLELHGTCPVCRKTLDGKDTSRDEAQPPTTSSADDNNSDTVMQPSNNNRTPDPTTRRPPGHPYDALDEYD